MTPAAQDVMLVLLGMEKAAAFEINKAASLKKDKLQSVMHELITDGFVESEVVSSKRLYSLTEDGLSAAKAIARHRSMVGEIVQPRRTTFSAWEEAKACYQRNQGNRHIGSVGVPC